jgi:ABC-type transporter Mla MlaB component
MYIEETSNESIVHCGSHMDLSSVVSQKETLLEALHIKKSICLEASEISKIDTAGIQLLLNFVLAAKDANIIWYWKNPATQLINMAELLGIDRLLAIKQSGSV